MISQCIVFDFSGDVLYSWVSGGGKLEIPVVNRFILDVLINDAVEMDGGYSTANEMVKYIRSGRVVYCVTYAKLLTLSGVEGLLQRVKLAFDNEDNVTSVLVEYQEGLKSHLEANTPEPNVETVAEVKKTKQKGNKKSRKWGEDGTFYEDNGEGDEKLDFSHAAPASSGTKSANVSQLVGSVEGYGNKRKDGKFVISDLSEQQQEQSVGVVSGFKKMWSQYVGGGEITPEEFKKVRGKVVDHLVRKNVSNSVCEGLMDEIERVVMGQRKGGFTSLESVIKEEMAVKLRKLLTPTTSINLLSDIESKKDPYVISVVGVNGVGKSTNLSKLAYWLLQNDLKVLIAACDTFRSGAVEQLRVHVNNLNGLSSEGGKIELFELGYGGKDLVSKIARGAITHARDNNFDVVLMDTAGRRHNDSQLMAPLASFAQVANPDKIIMVGEALVGSDAVMQAKNFNGAFGKGRGLDAFIVSKCDTVGGQLGSIVDLVYATKVPVLFVGVGQTYTDLRVLSVEWVINQLLS